ncbi:MAG: phenylacetate-CoA oxygenase subunit PaaI [Calditrichaeota bacterium]|nr:MAG: phenylacetate-CoA oxygenase subunit PaaI [Calditrichota bacterium]
MSAQNIAPELQQPLFEYLLRLGDDRLILGHRLSEWCGHGPILEEDIALANLALDCIGQASVLLKEAGTVEGQGRSEDDLAYFRDAIDFRNLLLVELPKGDFGFTIVRQFLFSTFSYFFLEKLQQSAHKPLAGIAAKTFKENLYHLRHSRKWLVVLGDGTEESHQRVQNALDELWGYTEEMFYMDQVDEALMNAGIAVDLQPLKEQWLSMVREALQEATLELPDPDVYQHQGGRTGFHTEHLGHLLAEMQILPRSYPDARW